MSDLVKWWLDYWKNYLVWFLLSTVILAKLFKVFFCTSGNVEHFQKIAWEFINTDSKNKTTFWSNYHRRKWFFFLQIITSALYLTQKLKKKHWIISQECKNQVEFQVIFLLLTNLIISKFISQEIRAYFFLHLIGYVSPIAIINYWEQKKKNECF